MLYFLPAKLKGCLAALLILANTLWLFPILLAFAFLKLLIPLRFSRKLCTRVLNAIAYFWIGFNNRLADLFHRIEWQVEGAEALARDDWYLVTCNHQSWADIPAIQYVLNDRIPLLKFFLKKDLIWVPFLGVAWWALDFPFMRRYTKEQIVRQPALKGKDLETTRIACEKFRYMPVTVVNFMEGTRFTPAKHDSQQSPYRHLLKPRAGGTAFVLGAMGEVLNKMLDVTIVYPGRAHGFWDYLCGRIERIIIHIRTIDIPSQFLGMDYANDEALREAFQEWIAQVWAEKDRRIESLLHNGPHEQEQDIKSSAA
ncbi:acyltransferase [Marinobacter nanhaiticus D15-8W]|uniref:Acyltransferase n=1 Tax=Marinobacter nanhaiticus D15-8W TaxID=626887 RepID=N6VTA0_9GAMM|nr:acyltransferase [Marinobacter nanhaiticus]ENO13390.1 acyltransferase [Marinobacter nanhaiticus D15-8W]BES70757.1 acyltransferase [Marinobacter nanhaiticus D15-8W]